MIDMYGRPVSSGDVVYDHKHYEKISVTDLTMAHWLIDEDKMNNPMKYIEKLEDN